MICSGAWFRPTTRLLVDLGAACAEFQDRTLRELPCKTVECDEIWAFCYAKQKNIPEQFQGTPGYGDVVDLERALRRHQARPVLARR